MLAAARLARLARATTTTTTHRARRGGYTARTALLTTVRVRAQSRTTTAGLLKSLGRQLEHLTQLHAPVRTHRLLHVRHPRGALLATHHLIAAASYRSTFSVSHFVY